MMYCSRCDWCEAKSKLASLYTSLLERQDHSQLSSLSLAQHWLDIIVLISLIKGVQMLADFPCIHVMGGNNIILILTRQPQIDGLHIQKQRGTCFSHSDTFSSEIQNTTLIKVCGHLLVEHLIPIWCALIWSWSPLCCYNSLHSSGKVFH